MKKVMAIILLAAASLSSTAFGWHRRGYRSYHYNNCNGCPRTECPRNTSCGCC